MPRFKVQLERQQVEHGVVVVEAENIDHAKELVRDHGPENLWGYALAASLGERFAVVDVWDVWDE